MDKPPYSVIPAPLPALNRVLLYENRIPLVHRITSFGIILLTLTCSPMYHDEPGAFSCISCDVLVLDMDVSLHFPIRLTLVFPS